jgi:bifunctional non-homologous end joining protein LigD
LERQISLDVEALRSLRVRSITVDGEAVWAGDDGKSDFDKLHSHAHDHQVFLYAFDLLVSAEGGKAARTVA